MKLYKILLFAISGLLLSSCSTSYVIFSDKEDGVNFSTYKTFKILNHKDGFPVGANPINKQRINRAVYDQLLSLGYRESANPDLLVTWFVKVEGKGGVDYYEDYYGRWRDMSHSNIYYYTEGTLVVDIIDRRNQQVIWHGKTSDRVYEGMKRVEEKINAAVKSMFKKYKKDAKLDRNFAYFDDYWDPTVYYSVEDENRQN